MAGRGQLTEEIKAKAVELIGREINQVELRLMPYLMHCAMDRANIDPRRIAQHEREALSKWQQEGFIDSPSADFTMTPEFWNVCCALAWVGYCCSD